MNALLELVRGSGLDWCLVAHNHLPGGDRDRLCGIWIAPTADLLKLQPPRPDLCHRGQVDSAPVTLHAIELGEALRRLVAGDSWLLDAIFSGANLVSSEVHEHLLERTRDGLHMGYVDHYLQRAAGLQRDGFLPAAAALLLQADHLAGTGHVSTDVPELARAARVEAWVDGAVGGDDLDKLRGQVKGSGATRVLPRQHPRPAAFDEFLLFVRESRW